VSRFGAVVALVAAFACSGASGAVAQQPPYDSLPFAPPGAFQGRIVYQAPGDCDFHSYDLGTGKDTRLGRGRCDFGVLFSRDGRLAAWRDAQNRVQAVDVATGRRLWLGPGAPKFHAKAFSFPLFFSPDSSRLAYCVATRATVTTVVADARTGAVRGRVRGTCAVAYTARGIAAVRRGSVVLGTHRLFAPRRPSRLAPGIGAAIAANPAGTLLAVAVRRSRQVIELDVIDLAGRVRGRYRGWVRIPTSPQLLAPGGASAVVWWGCILQLAPFDRARGTFRLLYGSDAEPITYPAYSPDGRFAVMARERVIVAPAPPAAPLPAVVFDGRTFAPLYRLPFAAMSVRWVPPQ
jgi:hypothetical protein